MSRTSDMILQRVNEGALIVIEEQTTIRQTAKKLGVSKSTICKDLSERLPTINLALYEQVAAVLESNFKQKHMRGGMATKLKYSKIN